MIQPNTMQFIQQLGGLTTHVMPDDNDEAQAYKLVPTSHWHGGTEFPYRIKKDLQEQGFNRIVEQGVEYYMVPEPVAKVPYLRKASKANPNIYPASIPEPVRKYLHADPPKIKRVSKKLGT